MNDTIIDPTVCLILVSTIRQRLRARLLIDSIRAFGGALSHCPIWLFEADTQRVPCDGLKDLDVRVIPLTVPDTVRHYWFADKVYACAQAEELANSKVRSLVWLSSDCLIIKPPLLFDLAPTFDAAVRPVHVRNVGLGATEALDGFWKKVYQTVGVQDVQTTVESFVDVQHIRAYFNSHILAVNPSKGVFRRWFEGFESLVCDQTFQSGSCRDERHQIFLHQAVLSALIVTMLDPERIRTLPPDYSYPYNLHQRVPTDCQALALNDLVCIAYEDRSLDPNVVDDVGIDEPLRSWLSARVNQI
ncbi:MAG: hypothetical protein GY832_10070 [Chloroflexi bacterium]|nr:hypothetical protein [Chloroflexota bacterium]